MSEQELEETMLVALQTHGANELPPALTVDEYDITEGSNTREFIRFLARHLYKEYSNKL